MGSDRARLSYDPTRHYRSVVMQQGRVTLEADWNEAETIAEEALRHETLEIAGPAGTPDGGYMVQPIMDPSHLPFDFAVTAGTAYVGGMRLSLDKPVSYSTQGDWLDHSHDPDWVMPTVDSRPSKEFIYLFVREQEVSAVEDSALRDVALGGPDTAQRTRMIQHIVRLPGASCIDGLAAAEVKWAGEGLVFDPATMRLNSHSTLRASVSLTPKPDTCEPEAVGGYLGADNQLIRIQIAPPDPNTGSSILVWGFDDASFLYRVTVINSTTLQLQSQPVDAFHQPQAHQAVEVLRSATQLDKEKYVSPTTGDTVTYVEYVASASGEIQTLTAAYDQDTMQIVVPNALPSQYLDSGQTPQAFLRVWQQQRAFTPGTAVELGTTGLSVTLDNGPFHAGDYWLIAVRPSTPTQLYPQRYLDNPQPPDGPRMWACPLAAIHWENGGLKVDECCLPWFDNLVDLTKHKASGCCTVSVSPEDLKTSGKTLQRVIDSYIGRGPVKICLAPGTYELAQPLQLGPQHKNFTIEACSGGATLQAAPAAGSESAFLPGLITLWEAANVTFRGLIFVLPPPVNLGTGGGAVQIPASAGLRPVNCTNLSIEGCTFVFPVGPSTIRFLSPPTVAGVLAGGECSGFRLVGNRFEVPVTRFEAAVDFMIGFAVFPSLTLKAAPGTNAAVSAIFVGSWLDDAVLRDNFFNNLTMPVFVYSNVGLVRLESNTVRACPTGFTLIALPALAQLFNMRNVTVDRAHLESAVRVHNALYYVLAHPQFQFACAVMRGFPLPANFDPAKTQTVTPGPGAATDISRVQDFFGWLFPGGAAPTPGSDVTAEAGPGRVPLAEDLSTLSAHPLRNVLPVAEGVVALNQSFSAVENQAFAAAPPQTSLVAIHMLGNDVNTGVGPFSGYGLLDFDLHIDNRDTFNLAGNTFIATEPTGYFPVGFVAGYFACTITGNAILNEAAGQDQSVGVSLIAGAPKGAITGNVFVGPAFLKLLNSPSLPGATTWNVFNAI